jgi:mono/diheme cytochrome c family protein
VARVGVLSWNLKPVPWRGVGLATKIVMSRGKRDQRARSRQRGWAWLIAGAALLAIGYLLFAPMRSGRHGADYRDADTVARGEGLFRANCEPCHGPAGRGENPSEPMGGVKPGGGYLAPALDGAGHAWHHSPEALFRIIKKGSPAADSSMVGWASRISDAEIDAVMAYFRSLWPPAIQSRYEHMFGP